MLIEKTVRHAPHDSVIMHNEKKTLMKKILVIYTGGTIGMHHDYKGVLRPFDFGKINDQVPELKRLNAEIEGGREERERDRMSLTLRYVFAFGSHPIFSLLLFRICHSP